ncbi:neuronal pentraxin-1-like [Ptychodera flava]|uniref:neuronal pentraxin-1-like n=1 Tax=Ptychodera flava TaxID=63121 RepID=UPI00396A6B51
MDLRGKTLVFNDTSYADVTGSGPIVSPLNAISVCSWVKDLSVGEHAIFSISCPEEADEFIFWYESETELQIWMKDSSTTYVDTTYDQKWHHLCISWASVGGVAKFYEDGLLILNIGNFRAGEQIRGGGYMIVGQEQDTNGGGFDIPQAFNGEMTALNVWDEVITDSLILTLSECHHYGSGTYYSWIDDVADVYFLEDVYTSSFCGTLNL